MGRSRSLNKLFAETDGSPLAEVIASAARLKSIKKQILDYIPVSLRPHIELAESNRGTLTLVCETGAVANRLRFMETQLLDRINSNPNLPPRQRIKTIVRSNKLPAAKPAGANSVRKARPAISATTAALIEQTSSVISNPELAEALKNLASRGRQQGDQAAE